MPIRAENRDRYPDDWKAIAVAVKEAAGWRCQCTGECGRPADHLFPDPVEREDLPPTRCANEHGLPAYRTGSIVVLTVAHLDHTPENCSHENLRALCQGCHLHYDRDHHAETRFQTRAAQLEAQMEPFLTLEGKPV